MNPSQNTRKQNEPRQNVLLQRLAISCLGLALSQCEEPKPAHQPLPPTSPNATLVPAPLIAGQRPVVKPKTTATSDDLGLLGPPQAPTIIEPYSQKTPPNPDVLAERATTGVSLEARFEWPQRPLKRLSLFGVTSSDGALANEALERRVSIDLWTRDRMALRLDTPAFPLAQGSLLLARYDREGHLLAWPEASRYRVLPQGSLRTVFLERRVDVSPMLDSDVAPAELGKHFGLPSKTSELTTEHGKLRLEQVQLDGLGYGGALLCRLLLELVAALPDPEVCTRDRVPVLAQFKFDGAELHFRVHELKRKTDAQGPLVFVPPRSSRYVTQGLPERPERTLDEQHLGALRRGPPDGELVALEVQNHTASGAYLMVDDAPLLFVEPRANGKLPGLRKSHYALGAMSFLGETLAETRPLGVPGVLSVGTLPHPDAGAPSVPAPAR